ncbi:LemA family protein [Ligilactobacillus acidipiscis]|uniref:LemA family protein n=1 Tax=Ligilactobacillus acidipiscis TaxID=89059 RepID=UPI002FD935BD
MDQGDQHFSNVLGVISALTEQYPDLKASNVHLQTMSSVDKYENLVRESRMIYNDTVTRFNRAIKTFPNSLLASPFGFTEQNYFKNTENKQEMPQWSE